MFRGRDEGGPPEARPDTEPPATSRASPPPAPRGTGRTSELSGSPTGRTASGEAGEEAEHAGLRAALLAWYDARARDLPWRRSCDPYAVWVSEIMLQQTRVETVIPYFERFLSLWPTVQDLAGADPGEVRAAWSGLGYYRRAGAMLEAAREISTRHGGRLPSEPEILRTLPGFGPYTAGAVASIAYDRAVPAVDGNVARVLARIGAIPGDVSRGPAAAAVWNLAGVLAGGDRPGDFNQALIELGALVCRRNPACPVCPARSWCKAHDRDLTRLIPAPRARPEKRRVALTALVLHDEGGVVLERRPEDGLFGGLFCPPMLERESREPDPGDGPARASPPDLPSRELEALESAVGAPLSLRARVEHVLTHRRLDILVLQGATPETVRPGWERVELEMLPTLGLPSLASKILKAGLPPQLLPRRLPGRKTRERGVPEQPPLPTILDAPSGGSAPAALTSGSAPGPPSAPSRGVGTMRGPVEQRAGSDPAAANHRPCAASRRPVPEEDGAS